MAVPPPGPTKIVNCGLRRQCGVFGEPPAVRSDTFHLPLMTRSPAAFRVAPFAWVFAAVLVVLEVDEEEELVEAEETVPLQEEATIPEEEEDVVAAVDLPEVLSLSGRGGGGLVLFEAFSGAAALFAGVELLVEAAEAEVEALALAATAVGDAVVEGAEDVFEWEVELDAAVGLAVEVEDEECCCPCCPYVDMRAAIDGLSDPVVLLGADTELEVRPEEAVAAVTAEEEEDAVLAVAVAEDDDDDGGGDFACSGAF